MKSERVCVLSSVLFSILSVGLGLLYAAYEVWRSP